MQEKTESKNTGVMVHNNLRERFEALKKQELSYQNSDYLHVIRNGIRVERKQAINKINRFMMANWCFDVANFCNFNEEIVSITMSYLDKFLSSEGLNVAIYDTRWFQLAVMCSFQIAIKFNTMQTIDVNFLLLISNGSYTKQEITSMEQKILSTLSWRLSPPTPFVFLDLFMDYIFPSNMSKLEREYIINTSRKQLKLAISDYWFSLIHPSLVAFASVLNSMDMASELLPKDMQNKAILNLSDMAGFNFKEQEKDSTLSSIRTSLNNLLNGKSDIKDKKQLTYSADTSSPMSFNALVA